MSDSRALAHFLARYREPSCTRAALELAITAVPFVLIWILMWATLDMGYWICLLLAVPAAGFLVRLFMIQHDCGHGSFFRRRRANDWVGRIIGVLTLTPYDFWRRTHALHHAASGNIDRLGIGDIETLTVNQFLALPRWRRLRYRLYRHPIVMFGVGPAYLFILRHRLPRGLMSSGWHLRVSTMVTNVAIAMLVASMVWLVGVGPFLLVQLPTTVLAGSIGVWLFYVQHQFEDTSWDHEEDWNFQGAALHGSSHYDLPSVLRWFTANIGVHHVHHLCSRIPYYRLPRVLRDYPQLAAVGRLTLFQSLRCIHMVLWDEKRRRLISFREMRTVMSATGNGMTPPEIALSFPRSPQIIRVNTAPAQDAVHSSGTLDVTIRAAARSLTRRCASTREGIMDGRMKVLATLASAQPSASMMRSVPIRMNASASHCPQYGGHAQCGRERT